MNRKIYRQYKDVIILPLLMLVAVFANVGYANNFVLNLDKISSVAITHADIDMDADIGTVYGTVLGDGLVNVGFSLSDEIIGPGKQIGYAIVDSDNKDSIIGGVISDTDICNLRMHEDGSYPCDVGVNLFIKEGKAARQYFTISVLDEANKEKIDEVYVRIPALKVGLSDSKHDGISDTLELTNFYSEAIKVLNVLGSKSIDTLRDETNTEVACGKSYKINLIPKSCAKDKNTFKSIIKVEYKVGNETLTVSISIACSCGNSPRVSYLIDQVGVFEQYAKGNSTLAENYKKLLKTGGKLPDADIEIDNEYLGIALFPDDKGEYTIGIKNISGGGISINDIYSSSSCISGLTDTIQNTHLNVGDSYAIKLKLNDFKVCEQEGYENKKYLTIFYNVDGETVPKTLLLDLQITASKDGVAQITAYPYSTSLLAAQDQQSLFLNQIEPFRNTKVGDGYSAHYRLFNKGEEIVPLSLDGFSSPAYEYFLPIFRETVVENNCGGSLGAHEFCDFKMFVSAIKPEAVEKILKISPTLSMPISFNVESVAHDLGVKRLAPENLKFTVGKKTKLTYRLTNNTKDALELSDFDVAFFGDPNCKKANIEKIIKTKPLKRLNAWSYCDVTIEIDTKSVGAIQELMTMSYKKSSNGSDPKRKITIPIFFNVAKSDV